MELGLLSRAPVYAPAANLTRVVDASTMLSAPPAAAAPQGKQTNSAQQADTQTHDAQLSAEHSC